MISSSPAFLLPPDLWVLAIEDTGTYRDAYGAGVPHGLVNGAPVVRDGVHLGTRAGRFLSRP